MSEIDEEYDDAGQRAKLVVARLRMRSAGKKLAIVDRSQEEPDRRSAREDLEGKRK